MSKFLVTGGGGFVGQHLINLLRKKGHDVYGLDIKPNVYLQGDIREFMPLLVRVRHIMPDVIIHAAALTSVRESAKIPNDYMMTNVIGTLNTLRVAAMCDVEVFVFISSGGTVYGEPLECPVPDTHQTVPLDIYGLSKLAGEHLTRMCCGRLGMSWRTLRYPNVYGPGQDPFGEAGVVAIFTQKMLAGEPVIINGDGNQTRDFCYVGDVVADTLWLTENGENRAYNIGTGEETSVNTIYSTLWELMGHPRGKVVYGPAKEGEVRNIALLPSIERPKTSLREGLRLTVESFNEGTSYSH